jgi:hypothetical protein
LIAHLCSPGGRVVVVGGRPPRSALSPRERHPRVEPPSDIRPPPVFGSLSTL